MASTLHELRLPRRRVRRLALSTIRPHAPLLALLALTAVLYLWGLSRNGYANDYYAAAVRSGSESWKAFFFGSLDAASYITVDKPPAALWLMELSGRMFGFSSFSMLLPQALEGVAAVWLLYAAVRRWFSAPAALLAGLVLAVTPVVALMFRFNNPDALLVLLLVAAGYAVTRALERASTVWLALAGAAVGFAFLTKMMQAFLVLPGLALAYALCAPTPVRRRAWQLLVAGAALVFAGGWWVAIVELLPASARPYIGGSTDNSVLGLIWGYNGLGRIEGASAGNGGANFSGTPDVLRLFNTELGGQISWLLPAAVVVLASGLVWTWRRPLVDRTRAALVLWGGWLVVSAAVYSFMSGGMHPYYTNTLGPAIAVLAGAGGVELWRRRETLAAQIVLGAALTATAAWSYALLARIPTWHPTLRLAILVAGLAAVAAILTLPRLSRGLAVAVSAAALFAGLAGPVAYTLATVSTTQTGTTISAGPASQGGFGGRNLGGGGPGGSSTNAALDAYLTADADGYTWVAATSSSQTADPIILATGKAVMALGGFNGSSAISLARFKQLVAQGRIHYYIAGGSGASGGPGLPGGPGGAGSGSIESWVTTTFKSITVGGTTLYDLTAKA